MAPKSQLKRKASGGTQSKKLKSAKKSTENPEVKSQEEVEHLSKLPRDCLLDVFARVDQEDLDEISVASQMMNAYTIQARSKARKAEAEQMSIIVLKNAQPEVNMTFKDSYFEKKLNRNFTHKNCNICKEAVRSHADSADKSVIPAIHELLLIASRALAKYQFDDVFITIQADPKVYLDLWKRYLKLDNQHSIRLMVQLNSEILDTFTALIFDAKPKQLQVSSTNADEITNVAFMQQYLAAVAQPELNIRTFGCCHIIKIIPQDAIPVIARFAVWNVPDFCIRKEHFMELILRRQKLQCVGVFELDTWAEIDVQMLQAGLEPGMKGLLSDRTYRIRLNRKLIITVSANYSIKQHAGNGRNSDHSVEVTFH